MKEILILAVSLFAIDMVYLRSIADHFQTQVSLVQGSQMTIDYLAAALCYVVLVFGLYWFVVKDANLSKIQNWNSPVLKEILWRSALLGWVIYGVYELTTKGILKKWMWSTVVMDTVWGGILFALSVFATWYLMRL